MLWRQLGGWRGRATLTNLTKKVLDCAEFFLKVRAMTLVTDLGPLLWDKFKNSPREEKIKFRDAIVTFLNVG